MSENVEDLTIQYEEDGFPTTKELDKVILSRGPWATILFRYQDWDRNKNAYGPDKFSIRRYQKRNGVYRMQSKFTISSNDQATKIIQALGEWING